MLCEALALATHALGFEPVKDQPHGVRLDLHGDGSSSIGVDEPVRSRASSRRKRDLKDEASTEFGELIADEAL